MCAYAFTTARRLLCGARFRGTRLARLFSRGGALCKTEICSERRSLIERSAAAVRLQAIFYVRNRPQAGLRSSEPVKLILRVEWSEVRRERLAALSFYRILRRGRRPLPQPKSRLPENDTAPRLFVGFVRNGDHVTLTDALRT